jgi:putative tryptophan/tyrosine transport system substrate-binding protein
MRQFLFLFPSNFCFVKLNSAIRNAKSAILVSPLLFGLSFPAEAQQPKKVPRIGYLSLRASPSAGDRAFLQGLNDLGYVAGQNISIEYRWAAGKVDRLPGLAEELVRLRVDILVTASTPVVQAAKNATGTIPIVMASAADPVRSGFVASLAQPGGNVTGMSNIMPELAGKRLELLREVLPKLSRVAFLAHAGDPAHRLFVDEAREAAGSFGMQVQQLVIAAPEEIEGAFSAVVRDGAGALIVQPLFIATLGEGGRIADLALKNRLPAVSDISAFAEAGGLASYGANATALYRRAAIYVDRILKGTKPADLPVEQPTKFELVINLKTAKQLGLTIPQSVLYRADKVIK